MPRIFNSHPRKTLRQRLRNDSSLAERMLWPYLRQRRFLGCKFRRQHGIGRFIVDFYCPSLRLVIEVDGDSHFVDGAAREDRFRQQWLERRGIQVIRFRNDEVVDDTYGVLQKLRSKMIHLAPPLAPLQGGGEY